MQHYAGNTVESEVSRVLALLGVTVDWEEILLAGAL